MFLEVHFFDLSKTEGSVQEAINETNRNREEEKETGGRHNIHDSLRTVSNLVHTMYTTAITVGADSVGG